MSEAIGVIGVIAVVAAAVGIAWPIFRSKSTSATIELLEKERDVRDAALLALERRCREDTARLEGRIDTLTAGFASELGAAIGKPVGIEVANVVLRELVIAGVIDRRSG